MVTSVRGKNMWKNDLVQTAVLWTVLGTSYEWVARSYALGCPELCF